MGWWLMMLSHNRYVVVEAASEKGAMKSLFDFYGERESRPLPVPSSVTGHKQARKFRLRQMEKPDQVEERMQE